METVIHHSIDDEQDAWRNEDPERSSGQDATGGNVFIIPPFQHFREGDHAHGHYTGADHAHHGGHHRASPHGRRSHPPLEPTCPLVDHFIDLGNEPPPFKNAGHEDEEGDGRQKIIGHEAKNPGGNDVHRGGSLKQGRKDHAHGSASERHRESHE